MSHYISGYVAKRSHFEELGIPSFLLPQDFAFAAGIPKGFPHPNVYLTTSYFGGFGTQGASYVVDQVEMFSHFENEEEPDSCYKNPIDTALAMLGVVRGDSDEFDALDLGLYRSMEDFGFEKMGDYDDHPPRPEKLTLEEVMQWWQEATVAEREDFLYKIGAYAVSEQTWYVHPLTK